MKEKAVVEYASEVQGWNEVTDGLREKGFFCILTKPHPETRMGGSSADFIVLDLGDGSARQVETIFRGTPPLKGRVLIVGLPGAGAAPLEGVPFVPREEVVRAVEGLYARLGRRA